MKTYRRLCIAAIAIFIALAAVLNVLIIKKADRDSGAYRVEAKRLADELQAEVDARYAFYENMAKQPG